MALLIKRNLRLEHPTEKQDDGSPAWFVVRVPLAAGEQMGAVQSSNEGVGERMLGTMVRALREWSYPEPITLETIERLDTETFMWLLGEVQRESPQRSEAEKKDSAPPSSPTSAPERAASPVISGT